MKFKQGIDSNQEFLFPKKTSDFISDNHAAKIIYRIVDKLDLSKIEAKYSELGQHAYNPKMMVRILFRGYSDGIRSSRKITKACEERLDFIYLTDGLKPSHDRISDFRKDNLEELKFVFKDIVVIGVCLGLAKLGNIKISIDGAKFRANASAKLTKDEESLKKLLEETEKEINTMFKEAEEIDKEEDAKYGKYNRGDELPENLRSKETQKKAIESAYEKLQEIKKNAKEKIETETNRKPTISEFKKIDQMKINITDNDAKFMKERSGVIKPNYNAQLSVDEKEQFILANDVVDECNDQHQLVPMIKKTKENIGESPKQAKADNGFYPQLKEATELFPEVDLYVDDKNRRKDNLDLKEIKKEYDTIQFKNLKKLLSKKGSVEYKKRMHTVEPPIGNIKFNLGYRYFLLRGLTKVKGEFNLMCIAHNLKKIVTYVTTKSIDIARAIENVKKDVQKVKNTWKNGEGCRMV